MGRLPEMTIDPKLGAKCGKTVCERATNPTIGWIRNSPKFELGSILNSLKTTLYKIVIHSDVLFLFCSVGETSVHITIVNGDLASLKLLVEQCGADVNARARGRFFMPEDCKEKIKEETNYDGE